jgi:hypothetical protein
MIRLVVVIYLLIINQCGICADSTGCIKGTVLDKENCEPVIGARVLIESTTLGAMVNPMNGSYIINDVPQETYTLIARCIGYNRVAIDSVTVQDSDTLCFDFELEPNAILIDFQTTSYCPRWLNKYEPRTIDNISSREIERMPAKDLRGILKNAGL